MQALYGKFERRKTFRGPARSIQRSSSRQKMRLNYRRFDGEYFPEKNSEKSFEKIKEYCQENNKFFVDKDFESSPKSLGQLHQNGIHWDRPQNFCDRPSFFVDGVSRFDVVQGAIGDCWLLASIQSLSQNEHLFHQVVPMDQDYYNDYCGAFRFNFWRYGEWTEVVVDDNLPLMNGKLIFMQSNSNNEFWSPLLEKAYAKLLGGYDALQGGNTIEAMTDMTGGISENILLKSVGADFFDFLLVAKERGSLLGCAVDPNVYNFSEERLASGLMTSHAYSITDVKKLQTKMGNVVQLVRILNPWGVGEWRGHWSDNSNDWALISKEDQQKMGLEFAEDGEFWMSFHEWRVNFTRVQICHLGPDSLSAEDSARFSWKTWIACIEHSAWIRRVNSGGCRNYPNTFWTNPQYSVTLTEPDDQGGHHSTMILSLIQKHDRKSRAPLLSIGYSIYKIDSSLMNEVLPREFFLKNNSAARSTSFVNRREISERHRLPLGHYVIIPSTYEPNYESEFVLRIFSVKKTAAKELDSPTKIRLSQGHKKEEIIRNHDQMLRRAFSNFAGSDQVVDCFELHKILRQLFSDINKNEISLETSRAIIASSDFNSDGTLGFDEFVSMWGNLSAWKGIFNKYDVNHNFSLDSVEFRIAISTAGFRLSNSLISNIIIRYSNREGEVNFSDFILCLCRLVRLQYLFEECEQGGSAKFSFDEFLALSTVF